MATTDSTTIPYGYCHCGCGQKTAISTYTHSTHGYVKGEPRRFIAHHRRGENRKQYSVYERFWSKVAITANPDKCWEWQASCYQCGYGQFHVGGGIRKMRGSHRVAYELTNGAIPEGMFVLHKCDNYLCCNPRHLFLGTQLENMQDMDIKGRRRTVSPMGENHPFHKLTSENVVYIRERFSKDGITCKQLGKEMGVTKETIWSVIKRKTWKHI